MSNAWSQDSAKDIDKEGAAMTAQTMERLLYKGKYYGMATLPLEDYLETRADIRDAISNSRLPSSAYAVHGKKVIVVLDTGCRRGYVGIWEIEDNKLFLIGLEDVDWNSVFPNQEKVFAGWYTGRIRLPIGKVLVYVHMGYHSIYEKDLVLTLENGVVVQEEEFDNSEAAAAKLRQFNSEHFDPDIFKYLIEKGVNVNGKGSCGWTLLHTVVFHSNYDPDSNIESIKYLIENGADVHAKTDEGRTPLDFANTEEVKNILREAMEASQRQRVDQE